MDFGHSSKQRQSATPKNEAKLSHPYFPKTIRQRILFFLHVCRYWHVSQSFLARKSLPISLQKSPLSRLQFTVNNIFPLLCNRWGVEKLQLDVVNGHRRVVSGLIVVEKSRIIPTIPWRCFSCRQFRIDMLQCTTASLLVAAQRKGSK